MSIINPMYLRSSEISDAERATREAFTREHFKGVLDGECVVEINEERLIPRVPIQDRDGYLVPQEPIKSGNSYVFFDPLGKPLRGRFVPHRSGIAPSELQYQFMGVEFIPGMRVHVVVSDDPARRVGRISDPLGDDSHEGKKLRKFLLDVPTKCPNLGLPMNMGYGIPDETYQLDESSYWTWLMWFARMRLGNTAGKMKQTFVTEIQNCHSLPSLESVVATGRARMLQLHPGAALIDRRAVYSQFPMPAPDPISDAEVSRFLSIAATER